MITEAGPRPSCKPANWPGWLAVGLVWLAGRLPRRAGLALTAPLGALLQCCMRRRRAIAARNVQACFPDWSPERRASLVHRCFHALARSVFEIAWAWTWPDHRFRRLGHVEGHEPVAALLAEGRGVLMVTAHMTCLEIGGRLLSTVLPASAIYRPLRSEVLEWYQNRCRLRYGEAVIRKRELRDAVRLLRQGRLVWYAPDQDFGPAQSVFAPFFGVSAATLVATHKLARLTGCAVVPMFPRYDASRRTYRVRILPPLPDFPGEDAQADLTRLNAVMEAHIREAPEQYWWIHRRFKSRPAGEAPFYDAADTK